MVQHQGRFLIDVAPSMMKFRKFVMSFFMYIMNLLRFVDGKKVSINHLIQKLLEVWLFDFTLDLHLTKNKPLTDYFLSICLHELFCLFYATKRVT